MNYLDEVIKHSDDVLEVIKMLMKQEINGKRITFEMAAKIYEIANVGVLLDSIDSKLWDIERHLSR